MCSHFYSLPLIQLMYAVHGGWSSWQYGSCTKTCGSGQKTGRRTCTNPSPKYGGNSCPGSSIDIQSCNLRNCPGDILANNH